MSIAHEGSQPRIQKVCLPIDWKNTSFLAHYDITAEDNLSGIAPLDGAVYTLRKSEGKYGGAIAVEQGTTNLIPGGTRNSYPTIGNNWGTYMVNKNYNNAQFFSIGTITSVVDNIVTVTWATGREFRTYDVVRPQTTGGGLTANRDYFIKMRSANSFSLHQYDASQDGSKGFRVHDSINNDIRIPINATDFPTMWKGEAHMPNSGLVKEVIPNGFSHNGVTHDCLRMYTNHTAPGESFMDYLAYGTTPPAEFGKTYTISFYYRAVTPESVGRVVSTSYYTYGTASGSYYWPAAPSFTLKAEWQRYSYTAVSPNTGGTNFYLNHNGRGVVWEIAEVQFEEKPFASSYTEGTRIAGRLTYPFSPNPTEGTINMWVLVNKGLKDIGDYRHLFSIRTATDRDDGLTVFHNSGSGHLRMKCSDDTTGSTNINVLDSYLPDGWRMITARWNAERMSLYVDGVEVGYASNPTLPTGFNNVFEVGHEGGIRQMDTMIDELRIDNIAQPPEVIKAWYESQAPFFPKGIHKQFL